MLADAETNWYLLGSEVNHNLSNYCGNPFIRSAKTRDFFIRLWGLCGGGEGEWATTLSFEASGQRTGSVHPTEWEEEFIRFQ